MASTTITKFAPLQIPLEDVLKATNNFHQDNIISRGGFGPAYRGQLQRSGELMKIAARRLDRKSGLGNSEFWTEVSMLSNLKHTNLVSIVGFCDEKGEKVIVTTYEANGSLEQFLSGSDLTWMQRLRICVGVARALSYLHSYEGRGYAVIHRFINTTTILLDEKREAKLSAFEISIKQSVHQKRQVFLCDPIGIPEYLDPEIEQTNGVTSKSDIYSFGVVLFEILCGRKAFIRNGAHTYLIPLAKDHYENKTLQDIIPPNLWNQMSPQSLVIYSKVTYSCLKERIDRPDATTIVDELEKALELQLQYEKIGNYLGHLKIPLTHIQSATDDFSENCRIPCDDNDVYTLYRAELDVFDKENHSFIQGKNKAEHPKRRITVVIKRYPKEHKIYGEEVYIKEIEMLSFIKHPNIVTLVGFCVEGSEKILVTENFSNGYLLDYLGDFKNDRRRILTWEKRLKICIDVAHALNYLHSEMEDQKMIHGEISCFSIWFGENFAAKIVNFWFSVFLPPNQEDEALYHITCIGGLPYTDPEFVKTCKLKRESDVYSFGVVLLEILCGKNANDPIYKKDSRTGLTYMARQSFCKETIHDMIDPMLILKEENILLNSGPNTDSLDTFIDIAYQCVAENQDHRPTMKVILKELEKALFFQEGKTQRSYTDQVVNKLKKEITEERTDYPNVDQALTKLEKLQLTCAIQGNKLEHLKIPLTHIQSATHNFSETYKIASLDGPTSYRVELEHFDKENASSIQVKNKCEHPKRRSTVVIKRYPKGHDNYGEKEYFTEIEMLSCVKHPNIVTLLGFCVEGSEMIVVTQNVSNGYLRDYLGNSNSSKRRILTWETRLEICIDVALVLNYLHSKMEDHKMIINRDICSYNIGLGKNWRAKIVDFWFSVFLPPNQVDDALYLNTWTGRQWYIDPEYKMSYDLKRESDVYSFGVVLFEILCGREANGPINKKDSDMIDPILKEENNFVLHKGPNKDSLHTFIEIAHQCVAPTQDQRPTMEVVVKELKKALLFQKNNKDNPKISIEDIKMATKNFHDDNYIGGGGFGRVYKGKLKEGDGFKSIVAKRLDNKSDQGEKEFVSELQILLEYKHENVIGLVGYCSEKDEKIIVFEYAPRKSLDRYLNNASLTWVKRLNICIDVARALDFLHGGVGKQAKVIHRDIKCANILLNSDWKAKLADFGLSVISPLIQEVDYVIDRACGTRGYVDPLYCKSGFLTIESDIYSFGVVLFEILCGRSTFAIQKKEGHYLPDFIKNKFEEGKHDEVVFELIREQVMPKSLATFQELAYQCLYHEPEKRPTTKKLLMQLRKALEFQNMPSTMTKLAPFQIPLEDVVMATNNFHNDKIIGHGGFVTAYKGQLLRSGRLLKIVARRFDSKHGERDLEFLREVSMLCDLNHSNLVSFIGFCDDKDEKIILITYEGNGSLGQYLNNSNLTWTQRLRICVGIARALSYLHYDERRSYCIIHCNINSDAILLDENWEAKLSGFENSIKQSVYDKEKNCLCEHTNIMGCIDPTIEKTGGVNHKSDIYSFGVVLFEILCGRKAFIQKEANRFLAPLVIHHYENGTLHDTIHHDISNQMSPESLFIYSRLACSSLKDDRARRPNTHNIVNTLEKALESQLQHENSGKKLEQLKIRLANVKLATNNFSETYKIGTVVYYDLYRVNINLFDKEEVLPKRHNTAIIKRVRRRDDEEGEQVFFTELDMLTSVKHRGIVTLLGFCVDGPEMILVIEDAYKGSLSLFLRDVNYDKRRILTWEKRLKICIDVAKALNYLHSEMEDQKIILLRALRSYEISLHENWEAKIGFGYSVFLPLNQEDDSMCPSRITQTYLRYYIDPEYEKTGKLKRESDVYSFGVVLLEILCGRFASNTIYRKESDKGLAPLARRSFRKGTLEDMIDPILKFETDETYYVLNSGPNKDSLQTFIKISHQCVAESQDERPTMKTVVKELEKALTLQENNMADNSRSQLKNVLAFQGKKLGHLKIHLADIKLATHNFSEKYKIGGGAYYASYVGRDLFKKHNTVMVQRFHPIDEEQGEHLFLTELNILTSVKHRGIVTLLGFCVEGPEMILVIEDISSNGSLSYYLQNTNYNKRPNLSWEKRLKICIDVARSLNYLHFEMEEQKMIIHCDFDTRNILLDEKWGAKIGWFGYSAFLPLNQEDDSVCVTRIPQTYSRYHIDPEYEKTRKLNRKSDVYSFGVVLLEILCGRLAFDPIYCKESDKGLASLARQSFRQGTLEDMIDPTIKEETDKDSLYTFIKIAHLCVAETQDQRPTMKTVVKELEKALFFQENKKDSQNSTLRHETGHAKEVLVELKKPLEFQIGKGEGAQTSSISHQVQDRKSTWRRRKRLTSGN